MQLRTQQNSTTVPCDDESEVPTIAFSFLVILWAKSCVLSNGQKPLCSALVAMEQMELEASCPFTELLISPVSMQLCCDGF